MQETRSKHSFEGAKLAVFLGEALLVIKRDELPGLPWPGYLDLPGGGREQQESPETCVLRETREETALVLRVSDLVWRAYYIVPHPAWFFAAHLPDKAAANVRLGSEGVSWHLMSPEDFVSNPKAIPHFRDRVTQYMRSKTLDAKVWEK